MKKEGIRKKERYLKEHQPSSPNSLKSVFLNGKTGRKGIRSSAKKSHNKRKTDLFYPLSQRFHRIQAANKR